MRYTKPSLSIDQQIELLASRGMEIPDRRKAELYLSHINYYRLRAYWLPFEESSGDDEHRFNHGTRFEDALALYIFDRKFRLLVLEAIERVEVSFRTRFAYKIATKYGSHAYLNPDHFKRLRKYGKCMDSLRKELERSRETFIEHYKSKYTDPELPPIWAICEVMSFGQLSIWFQNLKSRKDRQAIADVYHLDKKILGSFVHHLTHVRNLSAHHSRLWNRRMTITMKIPKYPNEIASWFNPYENREIYNTLAMLGYLLTIISPDTTWPERIRQLISDNSLVDSAAMGFPSEWHNITIWKK